MTSVEESSQIIGKIFSTVQDTVLMVANTVAKNRTKKYFAIKNGKLYMYQNQKSDSAEDDITIKDIEILNMDEQNKKGFYFLCKRRCFRMEAKRADEAEKWYKSIELVMSKSEEYLDLNRYVDEKVFTKVTGKSIFRDYESILEEHKKKLWEQELKRQQLEQKKRDEATRRRLEEEGRKKANRVAPKKSLDIDDEPSLSKLSSMRPPSTGDLDSNVSLTKQEAIVGKSAAISVNKDGPLLGMGAPAPVQGGVPFKIADIDESQPSTQNIYDDKAPLLASGQYSDQSDEDYNENEDDYDNERERQESIVELIKINDQRTESMYDIMMQREESRKISRSESIEKEPSDAKYDADKSRSNKSTINKTGSTFGANPQGRLGPPTTTVYEPMNQTS